MATKVFIFGNIKIIIGEIKKIGKPPQTVYDVSWGESGLLTKDFTEVEKAVEKHIKGFWAKWKWRRWEQSLTK